MGSYELKKTSDNQFLFNLKAGTSEVILTSERYNEIIGHSEMYNSTAAMETGIKSVKANGPTSPVVDKTGSA